ncbi:MAG TPA: Uma2 family endonuclease [Thermoanaerobaculia bacterium]|nr:Uma2 family endonuclease [Thermoanaerobaculia bacterium]
MQEAQRHYTIDEYFAVETMSPVRNEYFEGEILAMAGGSANHNRIARNVLLSLEPKLREGPCESLGSDTRILTASGLYTYPDVVVICGPVILSGDRLETITNPTVLVEVLSPSTRDYDRGEKFELYRSIPSFREYLLIEQSAVDVEHRWRSGDEWLSERKSALQDVIRLNSIEVDLKVADLYARVQL